MPHLPTPTDLFAPLETAPRWLSAREAKPPQRFVAADDRLTADAAFLLVSQGTGIVWQGDYHNARQLLQALARRIDKRRRPAEKSTEPAAIFHAYRQAQAQRARQLSLLAVPVSDGRVPLARAPDVASALSAVFGEEAGDYALPLTDLLAFISAREWRRNGVPIAALGGARIHPHYGVFPPTRQDYIDLLASVPLPEAAKNGPAFDIGTGSGVLGAVLAQRVTRVVATDNAPRAIACSGENFAALGLADRVTVEAADLFPQNRAALIVCNPPWLPGKADTSLEAAVYDSESRMLRGFLAGLGDHLLDGGEGWLVLSDLAELLGLRSREQLLGLIANAGLVVLGRHDTRPTHGKAADATDPLYFARARETVSVWRLGRAG
jgi:methylase of polypeptide subunit release factors